MSSRDDEIVSGIPAASDGHVYIKCGGLKCTIVPDAAPILVILRQGNPTGLQIPHSAVLS